MFRRIFLVSVLHLLFTAVSISAQPAVPSSPEKIRVACVGDSITFGAGIENREKNGYPAQMQALLGSSYDVRNFGVSGRTMLKQGDYPYEKEDACKQALAFNPNLVVIALGTNDSKPQNWKFKSAFADDTRALIASFRARPDRPRVLLCLPMPAFQIRWDINETVIKDEIIPILRQVAFDTGAELVDLHTAFLGKGAWFPDNIHPNTDGAARMAQVIGGAIAFKPDTAFDLEKNLTEQGIKPSVTSFHGYRQLTFPLEDGRQATVVRPYVTAEGHPLVWRGEFFGHEPQTDLALLAHGYHIVYVDAQNMLGAPPAMAIWERFHALLKKAGLTGKITLIGMSRGGLYCYNWAALHPETVSVLYGDAPVCDFKSWPLGKGRNGQTAFSKSDWDLVLKHYGFKDDAEALAYKKNPVDNLDLLAKAGIPIIHVVGQADTTVPVADNTDVVEQRYKALGGTIEVIRKPGVEHHPHSLENPEPIVDFILKHAR